MSTSVEQAAALIVASDGILITPGAGMGVDSGLPDFRGTEGFWKAIQRFPMQASTFNRSQTLLRFENTHALPGVSTAIVFRYTERQYPMMASEF